MTNCTNCFSGCVSTTSDKCVKYTGNDITFLNIHNGDSLEAVEKAITDWLATVLNGDGIFPVIEHNLICSIVHDHLPVSPTLVDVLTAIVESICDIEVQVLAEHARIDTIEANYTVGCVTVATDAGTHAVLQAVITKLCIAVGDITTLTNLFATCITTATIDTYIQDYLTTITTLDKMYTKMVPYAIYPFYPSSTFMLGLFGSTGEGLGTWEKIYLCNGNNGTPDLRGRSLIGATSGMQGGVFDTAVDPAISGNPTYNLSTIYGKNSVVLLPSQMAVHNHTATTEIDDPGHLTDIMITPSLIGCATDSVTYPIIAIEGHHSSLGSYEPDTVIQAETTAPAFTGVTAATVVADSIGGLAHINVHPVHACYYIMYRP